MAMVFAVTHSHNIVFITSVHFCFLFFVFYFLNSGIDKSTEWPTTPACPSLMWFLFIYFFNRDNTEGNYYFKILFYVCVCIFCVNLCRDWICSLLRIIRAEDKNISPSLSHSTHKTVKTNHSSSTAQLRYFMTLIRY